MKILFKLALTFYFLLATSYNDASGCHDFEATFSVSHSCDVHMKWMSKDNKDTDSTYVSQVLMDRILKRNPENKAEGIKGINLSYKRSLECNFLNGRLTSIKYIQKQRGEMFPLELNVGVDNSIKKNLINDATIKVTVCY